LPVVEGRRRFMSAACASHTPLNPVWKLMRGKGMMPFRAGMALPVESQPNTDTNIMQRHRCRHTRRHTETETETHTQTETQTDNSDRDTDTFRHAERERETHTYRGRDSRCVCVCRSRARPSCCNPNKSQLNPK
jgi:hypothetical protein